MNYFLLALKKYATFTGRSRRKEYWMFVLFRYLISMVILAPTIYLFFNSSDEGGMLGYMLFIVYSMALIVPGLAVVVRRLHDVGKSGWMYFVVLIPVIGIFWLLILLASDSEQGDNQYGPNPKQEAVMA